jgi:hypothetical protein
MWTFLPGPVLNCVPLDLLPLSVVRITGMSKCTQLNLKHFESQHDAMDENSPYTFGLAQNTVHKII